MMLLFWIICLFLTLYLLVKIVDNYFFDSLSELANRLKLNGDIVGAILMAIGSNIPKLFVSFFALIRPDGQEAVGMGIIVGSVIFNVLAIIGISAIVKTTIFSWRSIIRDALFYVLAAVLLLVFFWDGEIFVYEGSILLVFYVLYVLAGVYLKRILPEKENQKGAPAVNENNWEEKKEKDNLLFKFETFASKIITILLPDKKRYLIVFAVSIVLIAALSWLLVESAVKMAYILEIPAEIIALTILASGTSITDLMGLVFVAKKGRWGMSINNVIGSNIFNILIGLGLPWVIMLLIQPKRNILVSTENLLSSIFLLFATVVVVLFLILIQKFKIGRNGGWFLAALYIGYIIWAVLQTF